MNEINIVVTGTGRCGTLYLAKLLSSLGIPCSHEGIFTCEGYGEAEERIKREVVINSQRSSEYNYWFHEEIQAESSYLSAPYLNSQLLKNAKIIHLLRNPIKVIFSYCNEFKYFELVKYPHFCQELLIQDVLWEEEQVDLKAVESAILRAALFYVKWNNMIESKCEGRNVLVHRIEDDIQSVLDFIGKPNATDYFKDKRANTKRHRIFDKNIHDVPNCYIKDLLIQKAEEYGYDLFQEPPAPRFMML